MSRHRHIRKMNLDDELADYDDATPEQEALLIDGLEQVRDVIGSETVSGLSDKMIQEVLWEYFFDVEKTIQWALKEQERRSLAKERKDSPEKYLPPLPGAHLDMSSPQLDHEEDSLSGEMTAEPEVRSRLPLIVIAQQQQGYGPEGPQSPIGSPPRYRLSTITERTERTEQTPQWQPRRHLPLPENHRISTSSLETSYGEIIDVPAPQASTAVDPYFTPRSSSRSLYDLPRPKSSSLSQTSGTPPPKTPTELPSSEGMPDIPDFNSKSTLPVTGSHPQGAKQSKLSKLASSRTSSLSTRSESSASSGIALTGSIKTFPILRPSAQSTRTPSSVSSLLTSDTPIPQSESRANSSTTSHVRRAIQTALHQEAIDQATTPKQTSRVLQQPDYEEQDGSNLSASSAVTPTNAPEKLTVGPAKPLSKLAMLAQTKLDASRIPRLPKTTTEYLTPIANGSSVTTAITTSYQSLYSLTDPSRPTAIPRLDVVPLQTTPTTAEPPTSKLAMKMKRAAARKNAEMQSPSNEEVLTPPVSPMFYSKPAHARASPSAFASLLIDKPLTSTENEGRNKHDLKKEKNRATVDHVNDVTVSLTSEDSLNSHQHRKHPEKYPVPTMSPPSAFSFNEPSPDDIVLNARKGTSLGIKKPHTRAAEKSRAAQKKAKKAVSRSETPVEPPKAPLTQEKLLEEAKRSIQTPEGSGRKGISLVIIGHVDAGKSTLMGRVLYELGKLDEKTRQANERGSNKAGKSSFSWAWGLDETSEERERGITMDIALQVLSTPNRNITILDAPGHKEFVPNMISGASQADCALLVVDAATGEFEAGFLKGGQTREHLLLVRSLGVAQVIVAVNKLDMVQWNKSRYEEILEALRPFLVKSGFHPSKINFVPVGAIQGVNLVKREGEDAKLLNAWYTGPTLVDFLDKLEPPSRNINSPIRFPIANVYKSRSQGVSVAVSGRLSGGIVLVGERLRIIPGDETVLVKSIEVEDSPAQWVLAGSNATLHLADVEILNLNIGSVLCSLTEPVPLATIFVARIIVFDIQIPITAGTSVEIYHQSSDVPATTTKLISIVDQASGQVVKRNPRVLTKGVTAEVQFALRQEGNQPTARGIPVETFAVNKEMGRVLIRRGGETIGAGIITEING